jgi:hypothetical protein
MWYERLCHYGDILAIPLFLLTFLYFYNLENKNYLEYFLMTFALGGFLADVLFVYIEIFVKKSRNLNS